MANKRTQFSTWFRLRTAVGAAVTTALHEFQSVYQDPQRVVRGQFQSRNMIYRLLWDLYTNQMFQVNAQGVDEYSRFKTERGLYHRTRSLYNPFARLVDFYAGVVWPGVWAAPAQVDMLPDGVPIALPLDENVNPDIAAALFQLIEWSQWPIQSKVMLRRCAAMGSTLVEISDMAERGMMGYTILWPSQIADLKLDEMGDVVEYVLEYQALDENNLPYTHRRIVNSEMIGDYKNDAPILVIDNPYGGIVPAQWFKHNDIGDTYGIPAIGGSVGKVLELNSIASHIIDRGIHKPLKQPRVMWTDGVLVPAFDSDENDTDPDAPLTTDGANGIADLDEYDVVKGSADGKTDALMTEVDLEQMLAACTNLMNEIEADHPELTFWHELLTMTAVTGPAINRLSGNVAQRTWEASNNYDTSLKRLKQKGIAICGFRAREGAGGWAVRSAQQQVFAPFDLTSYEKGQIAFTIQPRVLMPETENERLDADNKRASYANTIKDRISRKRYLKLLKFSDAEIQEIESEMTTQDVVTEPETSGAAGGGL